MMPQTRNVLCRLAKLVFLFPTLISLTDALNPTVNLDPTGQGCVDPTGFVECFKTQSDQAKTCVANAENTCEGHHNNNNIDSCVAGCTTHLLAANIGCWLQSCWNQVYSCEYQGTVIEYLAIFPHDDIPFYPPPENAPGSCVCNLANVWGNLSAINSVTGPCYSMTLTTSKALGDCTCCMDSVYISNVLNICPNNNLTLLGLPSKLTEARHLLADHAKDTNNCAILDTSTPDRCAASYRVTKVGSTWYNPLQLPTSEPGILPLSNLPGTGLTDFGAASITLTLSGAYTSVITPAAFAADAGSIPPLALASAGAFSIGTGVATGATAANSAAAETGTTANSAAPGTDTAVNSAAPGTGTVANSAAPGTGTAAASSPSAKSGVDALAIPPSLLMICSALAVVLSAL